MIGDAWHIVAFVSWYAILNVAYALAALALRARQRIRPDPEDWWK